MLRSPVGGQRIGEVRKGGLGRPLPPAPPRPDGHLVVDPRR